jgi:hypothetical protein
MVERSCYTFCLMMVVFASGVVTVLAQSWYAAVVLNGHGVQSPVGVASEQQCIAQCNATAGCSAISYSRQYHMCIITLCANLQMVCNSFWETVVLSELHVSHVSMSLSYTLLPYICLYVCLCVSFTQSERICDCRYRLSCCVH